MEVNPLIHEVEDILPKGQCGACGFAGCAKYAEAVVEDETVPPNLCVPGKAAVAAKVAELTGKKAEAAEPKYAQLKCRGTKTAAVMAARYEGIHDCAAAKLIQGGPKGCKYGCIGFGNCVRACQFDAMHIVKGVAQVDRSKCVGCGACADACPKDIVKLIPEKQKIMVACRSQDKGGQVMKICKAGCIGCMKCQRECPNDAIHVENFLAKIDPEKCTQCGHCVGTCTRQIIRKLDA
jgi:Na+-translocating ferredoxin:NAD+ oxidoreductase RNF subunit RnfB